MLIALFVTFIQYKLLSFWIFIVIGFASSSGGGRVRPSGREIWRDDSGDDVDADQRGGQDDGEEEQRGDQVPRAVFRKPSEQAQADG